jgi:hypothetical protein
LRILWIAWAAISLVVALVLALAKGHPPGLVFVPFVAVAWLVGHLIILAVGHLTKRLVAARPEAAASPLDAGHVAQWIARGVVGVALLGATAFVLFMAGSLYFGQNRGLIGALVAAAALAVWAVLAALLAGLVARRAWAVPALRWALGAAGLWFAWMLVGGAIDNRPAIAGAGLGGLVLIAWLMFALRPRAGVT